MLNLTTRWSSFINTCIIVNSLRVKQKQTKNPATKALTLEGLFRINGCEENL